MQLITVTNAANALKVHPSLLHKFIRAQKINSVDTQKTHVNMFSNLYSSYVKVKLYDFDALKAAKKRNGTQKINAQTRCYC